MSKRIIQTELAPAAIGPYSQAIRIGDFLYTSGQIALDPKSGKFLSGEIKEETEQTLRNISAILQADGLELENVIKTTVYLSNLNDFEQMNQIYENGLLSSRSIGLNFPQVILRNPTFVPINFNLLPIAIFTD